MGNYVKLSKVVEKLNLKNLTPDVDMTEKKVMVPDINRPALQLTGFFEHFAYERVQLIGCVEYTFLENVEEDEKRRYMICYCLIKYRVSFSVGILNRMTA